MSKFPKKKMTPLTEEELNAVTISSFIRKQLKSSVQEKSILMYSLSCNVGSNGQMVSSDNIVSIQH